MNGKISRYENVRTDIKEVTVHLTDKVEGKLLGLKGRLERDTGRSWSRSEVIEYLLAAYDFPYIPYLYKET